MSVPRSALRRCLAALFCAAAVPCSALAQDTTPAPTEEVAQTEKVRVAILPIRNTTRIAAEEPTTVDSTVDSDMETTTEAQPGLPIAE